MIRYHAHKNFQSGVSGKGYASLAQLVERDTCNIDVIGSNPVGGSTDYKLPLYGLIIIPEPRAYV